MKKFVIKVALFVAPIMIFLAALETIAGRIPNSYSYKYNYVRENGGSIEAVALGHSQLYDGFYPGYFSLPAFNLSNSNQTFEDDYYLLEEMLKYLPNLKAVILPVGYFDAGVKGQEGGITDKSRYYHKYMHLNYGGKLPLKYMFECLNPRMTMSKILQYHVLHLDMVRCDSSGTRNNHYLKDRTVALGYEKLDQYTVPAGSGMCIRGLDYLEKILQMLGDNGIRPVLVSPPYYWGEYGRINRSQKDFVRESVNNLCKDYPSVVYVDMEDGDSFSYDDFYDETHLNEYGGEKFTKILAEQFMNHSKTDTNGYTTHQDRI